MVYMRFKVNLKFASFFSFTIFNFFLYFLVVFITLPTFVMLQTVKSLVLFNLKDLPAADTSQTNK